MEAFVVKEREEKTAREVTSKIVYYHMNWKGSCAYV
jgi:hypothetical protein